MHFHRTIVFHSPSGQDAPPLVTDLAAERGLQVVALARGAEVSALVNQNFPACIVLDGMGETECIRLCRALKSDPFTAIVPMAFLVSAFDEKFIHGCLEAGADEVLTPGMNDRERRLRLQMMLDRAVRDVSVHPTTRLPGTVQIERDMAERMRRGELFAVCYADLDHFKEFNDRYGYNEGDRVILLLSRILRDIVKGNAPDGFIGHIGGDDFIFNVPFEHMRACCDQIIEVLDALIPYQYGENDRRSGYFLGKDRRGNVLRIPLMTLSIGVVTNQHRHFTHTARISELATEMKSYAKTLTGSVYAVDRRRDAGRMVLAGTTQTADSRALELPNG